MLLRVMQDGSEGYYTSIAVYPHSTTADLEYTRLDRDQTTTSTPRTESDVILGPRAIQGPREIGPSRLAPRTEKSESRHPVL